MRGLILILVLAITVPCSADDVFWRVGKPWRNVTVDDICWTSTGLRIHCPVPPPGVRRSPTGWWDGAVRVKIAPKAPTVGELRPQAPVKPRSRWVLKRRWRGQGDMKTEPFVVSGEWRVDWVCRGDPEFVGLSVWAYRPGDDLYLEQVFSTPTVGSGTSRMYDSGRFYLDINSANCVWEILVYAKE